LQLGNRGPKKKKKDRRFHLEPKQAKPASEPGNGHEVIPNKWGPTKKGKTLRRVAQKTKNPKKRMAHKKRKKLIKEGKKVKVKGGTGRVRKQNHKKTGKRQLEIPDLIGKSRPAGRPYGKLRDKVIAGGDWGSEGDTCGRGTNQRL